MVLGLRLAFERSTMQKSNIPWCTHTWNPVIGCPPPLASKGCERCYARKLHNGRHKAYLAGKRLPKQYAKPFEEIQLFPDRLDDPLHCRAKDAKIFVCSMSDLFHEKVPFDFIDKVMAVIGETRHIYQILTKRPERMKRYFTNEGQRLSKTLEYVRKRRKNKKLLWARRWPWSNIWLGPSISTQEDADRMLPIALKIPATVHIVSLEPMLERVDILKYLWPRQKCVGKKGCGFTGASYEFDNPKKDGAYRCPKCGKNHSYLCTDNIDWVIIGCESGPKARLCSNDDIRYVNRQCREAGVPFFNKQVIVNGKCNKNPKDWPADLRIQEYPK